MPKTPIVVPRSFKAIAGRSLVWNFDAGIGYAPPIPTEMRTGHTEDADAANVQAIDEGHFAALRREFVERAIPDIDWSATVDVTFGERSFGALTGCKMFDLNHQSARELAARGAYHDLTARRIDHACFWDTLDRFIEPGELLRHVVRNVFISLPLHLSVESIIESAYFEHGRRLYYWTHAGFAHYIEALGFESIGGAYMVSNLRPKGIVGVALRRVRSI